MSRDDMPTQRIARYPQQPDPAAHGSWAQGGPVTRPMRQYSGPDLPEVLMRAPRPLPPRRRPAEPKREGMVRLSSAVTFALLAFAAGFLGGVGLVAGLVLYRQ